jgi:glycosyltransferase involved in cell wall biosynthesis
VPHPATAHRAAPRREAPPADRPAAPPASVHVLHTRYRHWGQFTGTTKFIPFADPARVTITAHPAAPDDSTLPLLGPKGAARRLGDRVRARLRAGGMAWYTINDLRAELRMLRRAALGRADVVHLVNGEHSAQFLPGLLRRAPGRTPRVVATYHQPPALLDGLLDRRAVARLDHVVLMSSDQGDWFRALLPADCVEVIPHGVDTEFFIPAAGARAEDGRLRCVTVGHWLRDWGAMRGVAERLASTPGVEFHVVTARRTGLEGLANVVRHRDLGDEALRDLYRGADVLLLPLTAATANNALLEGMACGLPVVSSDLPAVRAYVGDDAAALAPAGPPDAAADALADALLRLRADPAARRAAGARARARAETLAWPVVARAYVDLYTRLAGRG